MTTPTLMDIQTLRQRAVEHATTHLIDGPRRLRAKTLRFVAGLSAHVVMRDAHQSSETPAGQRRLCMVRTATSHTLRRLV